MTRKAQFVGTVAAAAGVMAATAVGVGEASAEPVPNAETQSCTASFKKPTFPFFISRNVDVQATPAPGQVAVERDYPAYNVLSYFSQITLNWTNHASGEVGTFEGRIDYLTHGTGMSPLGTLETGSGPVTVDVGVRNHTVNFPHVTHGNCRVDVQVP